MLLGTPSRDDGVGGSTQRRLVAASKCSRVSRHLIRYGCTSMTLRGSTQRFGPLVVLFASALCLAEVPVPAPAAASPDGVEFFEKKVRPLLSEHCFQCHSAAAPKGIKGGLSLDNR